MTFATNINSEIRKTIDSFILIYNIRHIQQNFLNVGSQQLFRLTSAFGAGLRLWRTIDSDFQLSGFSTAKSIWEMVDLGDLVMLFFWRL